MSFGEKIASLMARPGQDPIAKDDVPWWMKYGGRALGTVGGGIAIFLGVWNCVWIFFAQIDCLIGGMWQMVAGFLVVMVEAPCCCMFVDFVQNLSDWVERRPNWNRAAAYCAIAIPAIFLCPGMSSYFGSGLIFLTGVVYGMMAVGKKASLDEMITSTVDQPLPSSNLKANLVENEQPTAFSIVPGSIV
ncbi:calcium channel flower-like isoform X2 [Prorops nasuta]|uniref:calcium channel flower-like isoform X2 n=1 Tax=Prorops nasuta TaxID=863751 RepID=UPI0034CDBA39